MRQMHGLDIQIVYENNLTGLEFKYKAFFRPSIFDDGLDIQIVHHMYTIINHECALCTSIICK